MVCQQRRTWYDTGGTDGSQRSPYSMIRSHLDRVGSYLFAPGTMRLGVHLPPATRATWIEAAAVARDEFAAMWEDSGADATADMMIEWALVDGASVAKMRRDPDTGFAADFIQQPDFGVISEDNPRLDEQSAMCHWYTLSLPQIEWWLRGEPRAGDLLAKAEEHAITGGGSDSGRPGLVVTGISGTFPNSTVTGGFFGDADTLMYTTRPQVDERRVTFVDLWERRLYERRRGRTGLRTEMIEDWRVTTMIADVNVLFGTPRRNPVLPWTRTAHDSALPADNPFVVMRPRPRPDYFWGRSELEALIGIQVLMSDLVPKIQGGIERRLNPSKFGIGVSDMEEVERALNTPGGVAQGLEGQKIETIKNEVGEETFRWFSMIEGMFGKESGIPEELVSPGTIPGGVRNTGQFSQVAGIASGRIRKMALKIEDPLGQMATKGFHIIQRHDTTAYPVEGRGPIKEFLLHQLPSGMRLRPSAHSQSPIFAEQNQAKADRLIARGAIDGESYVDMIVDTPFREELKHKARQLAKARAEQQEKMLAIKDKQASKKSGK